MTTETKPTPAHKTDIFCVKCKTKTPSDEIHPTTMKNGRPATAAICAQCGTKKFRIGSV